MVNKEHFVTLYSPARERAITKKNILAGWAKTGLFPSKPDRVLRDVTKPAAALPIRTACEDVRPCPQDKVAQTPVSSEALTSLLNLIKQHPHDETSKQRQQIFAQKLANAAQTSYAQHALDQDRIRFLSKMNNEATVRRKIKSNILGNARVMSFEDIETARARRAMKDAANEVKGKGKRGRKRKSAAPEPDTPEPKSKVAQMSGTRVAEDEFAPEPWRAPVAWMW
ncbi:hypothetical protein LTS18_005093 [Coniosporium uncinatum]|uniref:Uncharacterized protein n=1 Tax=Coniosporium uncinatum TaxID=93489 RepID=A0ACC3DB17_9PEZI|nr:hypothetical protein LTS18_005093 [Coniosporium uncinatum]